MMKNALLLFRRMGFLTLCSILFGVVLGAQEQIKIVMDTPGTLSEKLATQTGPIINLRIDGKINGKDVAELRRLSGGTFSTLPAEEPGTLQILDIKRVSFVEDAEKFCSRPDGFLKGDRIAKYMFANCPSLQKVVLPKQMKTIDEFAFTGCTSLREVTNPGEIKEIGWGAFKGCKALLYFDFPEEFTTLRGEAFMGCASLSGVILPLSLVDIGSSAFEGSGLRFVTLHKKAKDLGSNLFKNCQKLEMARVLSQIEVLPTGIFQGCTALKQVELTDELITISSNCFENCSSLLSLQLPKYVQQLQGYSFWGCTSLRTLRLLTEEVVYAASAFETQKLKELTLLVPRNRMADISSSADWTGATVKALEDNQPIDKVWLEDDFASYTYNIKEWSGAGFWTSDHGAYINKVGDNQVLKLGDNEGDGVVTSTALNLAADGGRFRIRLSADGWNDLHSSLLVELKDKGGKVLASRLLTVPNPKMGGNLRVYDWEMEGGTAECFLSLSTSSDYRIMIIDDIKVYQTTQLQPDYRVSTSEPIDFGRVNLEEEVADKVFFLQGVNLAKAPKIKIETTTPGVFSVDTEGDKDQSKLTVMLSTDKVGTYSAFLKVDYDGVNVVLLPLRAVVQDPENVYGLDDSKPVSELNEDFSAGARLPDGWISFTLAGERNWMMRNSGGVNGNRYPAIDALNGTIGKVHAFLVLPAINLATLRGHKKEIAFDLAALKNNGATLYLVRLYKTGKIERIRELTATKDFDWTEHTCPIDDLGEGEVAFVAFEYQGEAGKQSTIYRVDNVKIREIDSLEAVANQEVRIQSFPGRIEVSGLIPGLSWSVFTIDGIRCASGVATTDTASIVLPAGTYIFMQNRGAAHKFMLP